MRRLTQNETVEAAAKQPDTHYRIRSSLYSPEKARGERLVKASKLRDMAEQRFSGMGFNARGLSALGECLLWQTFGTSGVENVTQLIQAYNSPYAQDRLRSTSHRQPDPLVNNLQGKLGREMVATLFSTWRETADRQEESQRSPVGYLFSQDNKVKIMEQWEKLNQLPDEQKEELLNSLTEEMGKTRAPGAPFASILAYYLATKLGLGPSAVVSFFIRHWKPLAVLVRVFGSGILPFVDRIMVSGYLKGLSSPKIAGSGSGSEEDEMEIAARVLLREKPDLGKVFDSCRENIVEPVLQGREMAATPAVQLLRAGKSLDMGSVNVMGSGEAECITEGAGTNEVKTVIIIIRVLASINYLGKERGAL